MVTVATYRQWLSSAMALLVSFIYGCKVGWTSITTTLFLSENSPVKATSNDISWMVSISYTSTIISVIVCFTLSNKIGRKKFIIFFTLIYFIIWLLILFASSITVIIVCFFFYGVSASMLVIICNIYIGEITTPKNREMIGVSYGLATAIGTEIELFIGVFQSYQWLALFPLLMSVVALFLSLVMVESPVYLKAKNLNNEAEKNFRWLHCKTDFEDISKNLDEIINYVKEQKDVESSKFKIIFLSSNLKLISVLIVINGISIINCSTIITQTGALILNNFKHYINGPLFVNLYNILRICCLVLGYATVTKFGRRILFLYGFIISSFIQLICALMYYFERRNNNEIGYLAIIIMLNFFAHLVVFMLTVTVALEILKTEILPHAFKEFYTSILAFTSDCFAFILVQSYFFIAPILGNEFLLVIYAVLNFIPAIFVYIFLQDTKGKSLYQIRNDYNSHS